MMKMATRMGVVAAAIGTALGLQAASAREVPAPTAGEVEDPAILRFTIRNAAGEFMPGRLTFVGIDGVEPDLFTNAAAAPMELAVRRNVIYSLKGHGVVTVPPGDYTIYASRGLEYGLARIHMSLAAGQTRRWSPVLEREVDTTGWVSGDFHLHTLTYSGHGDANLPERIISIAGEHVEFAVATDHNHHTDYGPTVDELEAHPHFSHVTGNEISVPLGHFNAFPLEPDRPVPPVDSTDGNALFTLVRNEPNRYGVVPIIQLNHPRWVGIDYFAQAGLDPATGWSKQANWSDDFDSVEIFNENEGWGYFDAEIVETHSDSTRHSVLQDWFNLLNRGHTAAAVGNSDSHTVHYDMAGYPRNFVRSPTDDPAEIDPRDVAEAIRNRQVFTTIGPFVEYTVNGVPMGGHVEVQGNAASLWIRVQAASWIDVDRVKVIVNGDLDRVIDVVASDLPVRLDLTTPVHIDKDAWLCLLVEGDTSLAPIVGKQGREVLPLAVTNPVWIDVDGDGQWTSPYRWASTQVTAAQSLDELNETALQDARPKERGLLALAAAEAGRPFSADAVRRVLGDEDRRARLMAVRAAARMADPALLPALEALSRQREVDGFTHAAALRAMAACGETDIAPRFFAAHETKPDAVGRYFSELSDLLGGAFVTNWLAVGVFTNADGALVATDFGPEAERALDAAWTDKLGREVGWKTLQADPRGFIDLRQLVDRPEDADDSIAYAQCWLHSADSREVWLAFGSDDGSRMWVNGELVHEDTGFHAAQPAQFLRRARLLEGWNRVLVKVENGSGDMGFYFRPLADDVRASLRME